MTLLEECIECLGEKIGMLDHNERDQIRNKFYNIIPITKWGRIDWSKFKNYKKFENTSQLTQLDINKSYYIVWADPTTPAIKTTLANIINNLDDVLAVSYDTWLLSEDKTLLIEFYHEDLGATIGNTSDVMSL